MTASVKPPRITLIHATSVAVEPIKASFAAIWPDAEIVNILDDSLSADRSRADDLTPAMVQRISDLACYGASLGSAAVLFTCSAFGPAIEKAAQSLPIPVLKPNEAMFEEALASGQRIGMVATFGPAVSTMEDEFRTDAARLQPAASLKTKLCADAMKALRSGDADTHNRLVADQCGELADVNAIMLAHFSTSRALAAAQARTGVPVLSSPDAAVRKLQRLILS
jgi:Asp/Glu/Hydantoin racemase